MKATLKYYHYSEISLNYSKITLKMRRNEVSVSQTGHNDSYKAMANNTYSNINQLASLTFSKHSTPGKFTEF